MVPAAIIRYIRQGRTAEKLATTATGAAASQAYAAMLLAGWVRADRQPNMPLHDWAQIGVSQAYDACKFCGDYAAGRQHAYATAVCYTLQMPDDALVGDDCNLTSLSVSLFGDRWLSDGAILSAVLSASATPPTWAEMLAGTHSEPLMAVERSNTGSDSAVTATLTWTATDAPAFVHLVLHLANYATHYGAWIEGSAMLDPASIDLTFSRAVTPDAASDPADAVSNLVVPVRLYAASGNRTPVAYAGANVNLESTHLRRHWTVDMLRGGAGAAEPADDVTALTPTLTAVGLAMTARAHIAKAWCPIAAVGGSTLWLRAVGASWPIKSTIRVSVFTGADMPVVDAAATWAGTGVTCIGTALFSGVIKGDVLGVPLTGSGSSPLWLVCGFEQVSVEDADFGDDATGFSLVDAHIAALPVSTDAVPHFLMLGPASGVPIGLIRDADGDPSALPYCYAMARQSYVGRKVSSFTWLTPGDISGSFLQASINVSGSDNFNFVAVVNDEGLSQTIRLACNGTLPAAVSDLEGDAGYVGAQALSGQCLATLDDTGAVAAVAGTSGAALAAAINGAGITTGSAIRGYGQCLLIRTTSTAQAVGVSLNATFVANVAALTGLATNRLMAIGNTWACFIKADGSAVALKLADGSSDSTVATWTNVVSIATAYNAIVGINGAGELLVANGSAYAGLDSTTIAALNVLYVFGTVIGNVNVSSSSPEFAASVTGGVL